MTSSRAAGALRAPAPLSRAPRSSRAAPKRVAPRVSRAGAAGPAAAAAAGAAAAAPQVAAAPPAAAATTAAPASGESVAAWPCRGGGIVRVSQRVAADGAHVVRIAVDARALAAAGAASASASAAPELLWGVYRASPDVWAAPAAAAPPGTRAAEGGGARSPMAAAPGGGAALELRLPAALAPATLAFAVALPADAGAGGEDAWVVPLTGRPQFAALIGALPGAASPLGPSLAPPPFAPAPAAKGKVKAAKASFAAADSAPSSAEGVTVNFAVRAKSCEYVSLALLRAPGAPGPAGAPAPAWAAVEFALDPALNRTGDVWHVAVPGVRDLASVLYAWRLEGDVSWERGARLAPERLLLDPRAPALAHLPAAPPPPTPLPALDPGDGSAVLAASSLASLAPGYAGAVSPPLRRPLERLRALELDVRSFSAGAAGAAHPGTFAGVAERLDLIRGVGANAVVLAPCHATGAGAGPLGRAAASFFAPDPALSSDPSDPAAAAAELREMVAALHAAGVAVIASIDVAFTAEGTDAAHATLSLRGLDAAGYYRPGGTLNCGAPPTQDLLLAAARRWARDFGVDGFCFLNAENMAQDAGGGVQDAPALAEALAADPVLAGLTLVAAPGDESLLPRRGARGFPHWGVWAQRNAAFGRDLTAFLAEGAPGMLEDVALRLAGSADVFGVAREEGLPGCLAAGRRPAFAFNSVAALGRRPGLGELAAEAAAVAAAAAAAAGGDAPPPAAATVAKALLAALLMSAGTPLLPQEAALDVELARFAGALARLRRRLAPLLAPPLFDSPRDISWHGASGGEPEWAPEWDPYGTEGAPHFLGFCVRAPEGGDLAVYFALNPYARGVDAALPPPPPGRAWRRAADAALPAPGDALLGGFPPLEVDRYLLAGKSAVVLVAGGQFEGAAY
jgi:isoamylase